MDEEARKPSILRPNLASLSAIQRRRIVRDSLVMLWTRCRQDPALRADGTAGPGADQACAMDANRRISCASESIPSFANRLAKASRLDRRADDPPLCPHGEAAGIGDVLERIPPLGRHLA
ncbi:hypothetical protein [Mitsuaria sp. BK037]|uniref:hypothetical protein n=1 Tax=Mitsuaria sp. BK037 TaxID=2587122 RepID=UPI00160E5693|nr:hypothetical protein [Mitsuaria sp. BK037]MBB3280699.1 hypothetical protein [Mitsuaria sp. BK037]